MNQPENRVNSQKSGLKENQKSFTFRVLKLIFGAVSRSRRGGSKKRD